MGLLQVKSAVLEVLGAAWLPLSEPCQHLRVIQTFGGLPSPPRVCAWQIDLLHYCTTALSSSTKSGAALVRAIL